MNRLTSALLLLVFSSLLYSCQTDYTALPTYSGARQLQAVIETPGGSSHAVTYDLNTKDFVNEKLAGKDRVLEFLPYPGNYGFIPSTEVGANGRGLSTLVLAERAEIGKVMEVIPIATLMLEKPSGDLYPVIISVPARPSERTIKATNFKSLNVEYPVVKNILQQWFVHYTYPNQLKFVGWKDERFAEKEIQRWMRL